MLNRIRKLIREDLWAVDLRQVDGWRRAGLATVRIAFHVVRTFLTDLGSLRAAGLTLVTLLAIVPLLALVSGIAKGLGYGERLAESLQQLWREAPADLQPAIQQIQDLVDRTSFGTLGVVGSLLLAYSGIVLYVRVEQALNRVWNVTHGRAWYRRITDFVALVVLVPLCGLLALSLQSLLQGAHWFHGVVWLEWLYDTGLGIVPHVLVWLAFTSLYKLMPSATVRWSSAAIAGMLAGSTWLFVHNLYLSTQISVARLNAIYATLAALPLLLVYLQVTWTIILVGAELSHAIQNRYRLQPKSVASDACPAVRLHLALYLTARACRSFTDGRGGSTWNGTTDFEIPYHWVTRIIDDLEAAGILGRLAEDPTIIVPLRPPEKITAADVFAAVQGEVPAFIRDGLTLPRPLAAQLEKIEEAVQLVLTDGTLADLG